jgi:hypothetical protein
MNLRVEEIDFNAFEKLVNLIKDYKVEYLWGERINDYRISTSNQDVLSNRVPKEILNSLLDLKSELKIYWIDSNSSSVFFTLGRWVDASWGIAKVYDPVNFHSPFKNGKIHEWEKVEKNDWYYFGLE